jgi:hypothetical protein
MIKVAQVYEEQLSLEESRDNVLLELSKTYERDTRTIERWIASGLLELEKQIQASETIAINEKKHEREEYSLKAIEHDKEIFEKSNYILNEDKLDALVQRLRVERSFYKFEAAMLSKYVTFLGKESNKYIVSNLREQAERCNRMMQELSHFLDVQPSSIIDVDNDDPHGIKRHFNFLLFEAVMPRLSQRRLDNKVVRLSEECQTTYKEYRSVIRETLFI